MKLPECKGCEKRREKILALTASLLALVTGTQPPPPPPELNKKESGS